MNKSKVSILVRSAAAIVVAFGSVALLVGCDSGTSQASAPAGPAFAAAVTTATAVAQDVPLYLDEIGRAVAVESVAIIPQVAGKIMAVHVEDGAMVKKGDLLFEIDARPFTATL